MRIVLIYPPPWKIFRPGDDGACKEGEGPPKNFTAAHCLSGDILNIPYGLLSLASQAKRAGLDVSVLNLFTFPWEEIKRIIRHFPAQIYGLSCFTSNRRGTLSLARLIRDIHPQAHITVGGPHASALPEEMLMHCGAIDTVIIGEGEDSFHELIQRIEKRRLPQNIAGTAWRSGDSVEFGPPRRRINRLDRLVPPCDYYNEYILVTSRGCAWNCTFCSSKTVWGGEVYTHSPSYVLDMIETITARHGQKRIAVKDETFTSNRNYVLQICEGILKKNLHCLWSCDTRADMLDEELLFSMRKAGCQRISLGIESASPSILKNLKKQISLDTVRTATAMAQKFGFQVRFYMIVGSRGETSDTLQESIDFVTEVKPSQVLFNPFTLFPGTCEFDIAEKRGLVNRDIFFHDDFFELTPFRYDPDNPLTKTAEKWLKKNEGLQNIRHYDIKETEKALLLFPDLHAAHLDLGSAHYRDRNFDKAKNFVLNALKLGYPLPGLAYNYLACICAAQGNLKDALENLILAKEHGYHKVVEHNIDFVRSWINSGASSRGTELQLSADHSFEVTRPKVQPMTPGSISIQEDVML